MSRGLTILVPIRHAYFSAMNLISKPYFKATIPFYAQIDHPRNQQTNLHGTIIGAKWS